MKFINKRLESPLSPILVDIIMQDLEERVLNSIDCSPTYYRYVNDIVLSLEQSHVILSKFNNYHDRLKFTIEHESNNMLSFLDLRLIKQNDRLVID